MAVVLVVDDDTALCDALRRIVRGSGHHVYTAADGIEAMQVLDTHPVNLAFVDLVMPKMDGIKLLTEIHDKYPHTKIVTMSAYHDVMDIAERQHAVQEMLEKPFEIDDIKDLLNRLLL